MDWNNILDSTDPQRIKDQLSLASVVQAHGVALRPSGERLVGICPFHDDHDASFAVWRTEDGSEMCGCWSCDFRPGDLFTFIQKAEGCNFSRSLDLAAEYLRDGLPEAPPVPDRVVDPEAPARILATHESTEGVPIDALAELLIRKNHPATAEWVAAEFRVGCTPSGEIVMPHFGAAGGLEAAKWRTVDRKPVAYSGSQLSALYGAWRDRNYNEIVVCEGESDTWAMAWALRDARADVVGLPSGSSMKPRPEWVEMFRRRNVTLVFDSDPAGEFGLARWIKALKGVANELRIAKLPEGEDVVSAGVVTATRAVSSAHPLSAIEANLADAKFFAKAKGDGEFSVIADFRLEVVSVVEVEGAGLTYEVTVPGDQRGPWLLEGSVLLDPRKMKRWALDNFGGIWRGKPSDADDVLQYLKLEGATKPRYQGTDVVGLHGNSFVLPDRCIGPRGWVYTAPAIETHFGANVGVQDEWWSLKALSALRDLHDPAVITPLLGWVAAAPLRSLCSQFPIMALVGGAGWGKTTLAQSVLAAFGFWNAQPMTLSSMTPFAIAALAGATNAFPVWLDEYRRGTRDESRRFLEQIVRDAWDGSSGMKGSVKSSGGMELVNYQASAPMLVTGEDMFTEQSLAERTVAIEMPREGKNPEALAALRRLSSGGLGYDYLQWLLRLISVDELPAPPEESDRHRLCMATVRWGWDLIHQFAAELGVDMGDLDLSRAESSFEEMDSSNPYEQVLREGLNKMAPDGNPIVWVDGPDICFRSQALVTWARNETDIVLPGKSRAMNAWLRERWPMKENSRLVSPLRSFRLYGAAADIAAD